LLGYPDQAFKRSQEALTLAQELSHPNSLAFALSFAAGLHRLRREGLSTQELAEALIALSTKQGFPHWLAQGAILQGWALAEQGQKEERIAQMRQGLTAYQATGAEWGRPNFLAQLAEAYGKVGQAEEGLSVLAEALALVSKTGERFYEAELYRLKGTLTLQSKTSLGPVSGQSKTSPKQEKSRVGIAHQNVSITEAATVGGAHPTGEDEAEACFHKAIEIARKQQAKSLELRATVSLARLWQRQGKQHAARNTLSAIYNWFTEGFDTKDLQEAKALLAELTAE
jgi:predicted ATPase